MSINYEMERYTELTGEDGTKVSVSRLGGYLDGYEKGMQDAFEKMKEYINSQDFICTVVQSKESLQDVLCNYMDKIQKEGAE